MTITFPPKNPYFKHIWNRTHRYNKMFIQVTTGGPREGKNWCNLVEGLYLDKRFGIEAVCFSPGEFLDRLEDIKYKGSVVMMSEIGVLLSARKWYQISNIMTNEILQTTGYLNPIAIFDVPDLSFVDSQARKMINAYCEVNRRGFDPAKMWVYRISTDRKRGEHYYIHPRIRIGNSVVCVRSIIFKKTPPKDLLKAFRRKEEDYKDSLRGKHRAMLKLLEMKDEDNKTTMMDLVKQVTDEPDKYKNVAGRFDWHIIHGELDVSENKAKAIKRFADKRESVPKV